MELKKELFWGLGITFFVIVLSVYYILSSGQTAKKPAVTTPITTSQEVLTAEEIAKHNSEFDCWFIVDNKVYDVTSYISSHPRGQQLLIPYCGQEATEAFQTKGGKGTHSEKADQDLISLYIGDLNGQKTK